MALPVLSFLCGLPLVHKKHAFLPLGMGCVSNSPRFSFCAQLPPAESSSPSPRPADTVYVSSEMSY